MMLMMQTQISQTTMWEASYARVQLFFGPADTGWPHSPPRSGEKAFPMHVHEHFVQCSLHWPAEGQHRLRSLKHHWISTMLF